MAASAINRTAILDRTADDYINQVYADQLATQQDEARSKPPAPLRATSRYLFRTHPGGPPTLTIAIPRQAPLTVDERVDRQNQKRWNAKYGPAAQEELDGLVAALNGEYQIRFTPIVGKGECYFATDDPGVAAYVRAAIARGDSLLEYVYEESPGEPIVVNGREFPGTAIGAVAAERYRTALANADEPVSVAVTTGPPAHRPARTIKVTNPPSVVAS